MQKLQTKSDLCDLCQQWGLKLDGSDIMMKSVCSEHRGMDAINAGIAARQVLEKNELLEKSSTPR
jgi:hypothetical protein